jgi:hypothetical protein
VSGTWPHQFEADGGSRGNRTRFQRNSNLLMAHEFGHFHFEDNYLTDARFSHGVHWSPPKSWRYFRDGGNSIRLDFRAITNFCTMVSPPRWRRAKPSTPPSLDVLGWSSIIRL